MCHSTGSIQILVLEVESSQKFAIRVNQSRCVAFNSKFKKWLNLKLVKCVWIRVQNCLLRGVVCTVHKNNIAGVIGFAVVVVNEVALMVAMDVVLAPI